MAKGGRAITALTLAGGAALVGGVLLLKKSSSVGPSGNLLSNGDFSNGTVGWSFFRNGIPAPSGVFNYDTSIFYKPPASLNVTEALNTNTDYAQQTIPISQIVAGGTYQLSGQVKTSNIVPAAGVVQPGAHIEVDFLPFKTGGTGASKALTGTVNWNLLQGKITPPTGTTSVFVRLYLVKSTGMAWFDALQLIRIA